jgi:hypothetical protein
MTVHTGKVVETSDRNQMGSAHILIEFWVDRIKSGSRRLEIRLQNALQLYHGHSQLGHGLSIL